MLSCQEKSKVSFNVNPTNNNQLQLEDRLFKDFYIKLKEMVMRCLAYISESITESKSVIPSDLSIIVKVSRIKNRKRHIVGFISYREGYYFQVIEGDNNDIELLYQTIKKDNRHKNIQVILDTSTHDSIFSNWDMRLVASINKDPTVLRFFYRYRPELTIIPPKKIELIKIFFKHPIFEDNYSHEEPAKDVFKEYEISMKRWPNFASITPSNEIIEICRHLIHGPLNYQDLLIRCYDIDSVRIDEELSTLNDKGLLNYGKKNASITPNKPPLRMHSAYNKLKSFLAHLS